MASIGEQILERIKVALTGTTPAGANVARSREIGITRGASPFIAIAPRNEPVLAQGDFTDQNSLEVEIQIFAREQFKDPAVLGDTDKSWDKVADPIYVALHSIVTTDAQLLQLCARVRRVERTFEGQEADLTAGVMTVVYRLNFLTSATDVSVGPKP